MADSSGGPRAAAHAGAGAAAGKGGAAAAKQRELPSDAVAIRNILRSMGVTQFEPRVLDLLLNFTYKYTSEVVLDAAAFAQQAGREPGEVEVDDVTAAIQVRAASQFLAQPSTAAQEEVARRVNAQPLPAFGKVHGIRLPPEDFCVTRPPYHYQLPEDDEDDEDNGQQLHGSEDMLQ